MKNLLLPFIFLLFILPSIVSGQSSLACNEDIHISLSPIGTINVLPSYLLEGDIPSGTQLTIDGENYFDKITFECDELKTFEYIVKAPSGEQCWGTFTLEDRIAPVIDAVTSLNMSQNAGDMVTITPDMIDLQSYDNCGIVSKRVEPSSFYVYEDVTQTIKFIIEDAAGNVSQSDVKVQVAVNPISCELENVVAPLSEIVIHNYTGKPQDMTPDLLISEYGYLSGEVKPSFGDCDFTRSYNDVILLSDTTSIFTINRTWIVTDWTTLDTVVFNQKLTNDFECGVSNVVFPTKGITLEAVNVEAKDLTPEKLIELGYDKSVAQASVSELCETYIAVTYSDQVFVENDGYTIYRTWRAQQWATGVFNDEIQIIRNVNANFKSGIICDRLPRIAPVGDCASGHTLDDSVEWPAFLEIDDYRISPDELETYSNIQHEDSRPIFYKNQDDLVATYFDKFVEITADKIKLRRVWTVTSLEYGFEWEYEQGLIINYTQGLVAVNTSDFRPIPGVKINGEVVTDENGKAIVLDDVNSISLNDGLNGVDILDLILMRAHLIGDVVLDENQLVIADLTKDGALSGSDIYIIVQNLLGSRSSLEWFFKENNEGFPIAIRPKGVYEGMKLGDIDGSALLGDEKLPLATNTLIMDDKLLNKGGSYDIPLLLDHSMQTKGLELIIDVDLELVEIEDVVSSYSDVVWYVTDDGHLTMLLINNTEVFSVENAVVEIKLKALHNSLLHQAISMKDNSFSASIDYSLDVINGEITGQIKLGVLNPALQGLAIYPNPASDYLTVDVSKVKLNGDLSVVILNTNGQEVLKQENSQNIDISSLPSGMYFYRVNYAGYTYIDKLSVVK